MILGLNTNHDHNGKVFHVQTEDSGLDNPVVVTHCFIGGTIIATRRSEYGDALDRDDLEDHIRGLARTQHRAGVGEAEWTRHCTYSDPDRFFSYRRATHEGQADYGRLISAIAL